MTTPLEDAGLLAIKEDIFRLENERDDLLAQANAANCEDDRISLNAALNMKEDQLRSRCMDFTFHLNMIK